MSKENKFKNLVPLTSIRGLAAWWVVFFHFQNFLPDWIINYFGSIIAVGYLAVDLFFVLSGFVLFLNYHTKVTSPIEGSVFNFYYFRFTRIFPLHVVVMLLYLIIVLAHLFLSSSGKVPDKYSFDDFVASMFLIHAWGGIWELSWNDPSWSISAEWSAYFLFPLISLLFIKYIRKTYLHILIVLALCAIYAFVYSQFGLNSINDSIMQMAVIRCVIGFTLGCAACSLWLLNSEFVERSYHLMTIAIILLLLYAIFNSLNEYYYIPLIFTLLILGLTNPNGILSKILENRWLEYLGKISFSTYLIHYFVYDVFKLLLVENGEISNDYYLVITFILILILSSFFYHGIELIAQKKLRAFSTPIYRYISLVSKR